MGIYQVRLVNDVGRTIGFGDRWQTHRVRNGPDDPVLGQRHVGITIACVRDGGEVLFAHRRHRIFDRVWTLSGDTHPYRRYGSPVVEGKVEAAGRCAMDDLGVRIRHWPRRMALSYSARDPRDPRYCENELLHVLVTKHDGPFHMNAKNAYELRWVKFEEVSRDSAADLEKEPINRKYAPWVHALFSLSPDEIEATLAG